MFGRSIKIVAVAAALLLESCVPAQQILDPQQRAMQEKEVVRLLTESVVAMRRGNASGLEEAQSALELAREIKPGDPRIYDGLGAVAFRKGELDLAKYLFQKALAIDLLYDRAYAHLALVAEQRGELEVAAELLKIAVQLNPTNYRSRNNYGVALADSGVDKERAFDELLKAVRAQGSPDKVTARNIEILAPDSAAQEK